MKDLLLCVQVVVKSLNLEISCTLSLADYLINFGNLMHVVICRLRQIIILKSVPHVQHDYFSSFMISDAVVSVAVVLT